jgi:hypothetical protein
MALVLPSHVVRAKIMAKLEEADRPKPEIFGGDGIEKHQTVLQALLSSHGKDVVHEVDTAIPEGLPEPGLWRVTLMPVRQIVETRGGIVPPPEFLDVQNWTHMLWKVCCIGPLVCRGPAWHGFTDEELNEVRPRIGELYLCDPKAPRRYKYKGITFIVVNDDVLWSKVDPNCIDGLEFKSGEL